MVEQNDAAALDNKGKRYPDACMYMTPCNKKIHLINFKIWPIYSTQGLMSTEKRRNENFKTETEIQSFFRGIKNSSLKRWYKVKPTRLGHRSPHDYDRYTNLSNGNFNYDTITDEWYKWYLRRGNGQDNISQFGDIYFLEPLPFQKPYFRRIIMKQEASLLVPIYSFSASSEEYPSLKESELIELIKTDLSGIDSVNASLDGQVIRGYCVIRDRPLQINNFPVKNITEIDGTRLSQNSINLYHGGFWMLIRKEDLPPGDHLLSFSAESRTFEVEAKILINSMY
jgi:hypothetical protein